MEYHLDIPLSVDEVKKLKVGDILYVTGTIFTARDEAHKRALDFHEKGKQLPIVLEGLPIFHCGPIMKNENGVWKVIAAGPTTSTRMEIFEDQFIKNFKIRAVIGKGGMGQKTVDAMKDYGVFYGAFTGGAAILAAKSITKVKGVQWMDLGMPEAMWQLEVKEFGPITVAIDTKGNNLFEIVTKNANNKKQKIFQNKLI